MQLGSSILKADMERICSASFIQWERLRGKTVLVTGATGLIGHTLVNALAYADQKLSLGLTVLALVRDEERAHQRFENVLDGTGCLRLVVGSMEQFPAFNEPIDYIVHGASQTASSAFVKQPVETIRTAVRGTESVLELARQKRVSSMVYLSSMEIYGFPEKGHRVKEEEGGAFSSLETRNSYPISKLLCENLCCGYASEYNVPAKILRLTQTFGPGVNYNDGRIFAEFGRCVIEKRDIVLKTKGETERSYLYTADAATAILTVLLQGRTGQAYNAADESTYCSIAEMAQRVAARGGISVRYDIRDTPQLGYPNTLYMDLDTTKLRKLGWMVLGGGVVLPSLEQMYENMLSDMRECK